MLGIIRTRISPYGVRKRTERTENIAGISFFTVVLELKSSDGVLDRAMMRQSARLMAIRGVTSAAAPDNPYLHAALEKYRIDLLTHFSLMRSMAPQIIDYILGRRQQGAVLLYARHMDNDVIQAAEHAARHYAVVMLDLGVHGERIRQYLMESCGAAALLGQVVCPGVKTAALFFDKPNSGFRLRQSKAVSVALCREAVKNCDYNDIEVISPLYEPHQDTDAEGILNALAAQNKLAAGDLHIGSLLKKNQF